MADTKISALTNLASPSADAIFLFINDIAGTPVQRIITLGQLAAALGVRTYVDVEIPSGTIDGSNATFTLAHTPVVGSVQLFLNGVKQIYGTDYTIATATITAITVPQTGDSYEVFYRY